MSACEKPKRAPETQPEEGTQGKREKNNIRKKTASHKVNFAQHPTPQAQESDPRPARAWRPPGALRQ